MEENNMLNRNIFGIFSTIIVCLLVVFDMYVYADDFDREKQALSIISDFADKLCRDASVAGKQKTSEIKGEAKVSMNTLISKIADLGFKGATNYQYSEYEGLVQKDLKDTFKNTNDCRIQVFKELKEKLLNQKAGGSIVTNKPKPAKSTKLNTAYNEQSNATIQKSLDTDLDYYIKNFSDIDLGMECNDNKEYMIKYRQAHALLDLIEAKAKKTKNTEILEKVVLPRRQGIHRVSNNCTSNTLQTISTPLYILKEKDIEFLGYDTYKNDNNICYRSKLVWDGSKWIPKVSYYNKATKLMPSDNHPAILYISLLESPNGGGKEKWQEHNPVDFSCDNSLAWSNYNYILSLFKK
jgi:hypothetical protein